MSSIQTCHVHVHNVYCKVRCISSKALLLATAVHSKTIAFKPTATYMYLTKPRWGPNSRPLIPPRGLIDYLTTPAHQ